MPRIANNLAFALEDLIFKMLDQGAVKEDIEDILDHCIEINEDYNAKNS